MCGESAYIPPSELTTVRRIGSGSFAKGELFKPLSILDEPPSDGYMSRALEVSGVSKRPRWSHFSVREKPEHYFIVAVEICKHHQPGKEERTVAVKRLTSQAAVDIAQFASEANILRKLINE